MVDLHPETLAAVWSQNGRIRYYYRGTDFPWVKRKPRDTIVSTTAAYRAASSGQRCLTNFTEAHPIAWTDTPDLNLWEQTRVGKDGYAVTLLWVESSDNDEGETSGSDDLDIPRFR